MNNRSYQTTLPHLRTTAEPGNPTTLIRLIAQIAARQATVVLTKRAA